MGARRGPALAVEGVDAMNGARVVIRDDRSITLECDRRTQREAERAVVVATVKAIAGGLLALASMFAVAWVLWSQPIEQAIQRLFR